MKPERPLYKYGDPRKRTHFFQRQRKLSCPQYVV
jgi:hypothetical protein